MLMERVLPRAPASSMEGSWARSFMEDFVGGDADFGGVPGEAEDGDVVGDGLLEEVGGEGGDVLDHGGDDVGAAGDLGLDAGGGLGVEEPIDGGDHADDLFLGDLHAAAYALTGVVVGGCEFDEVFLVPRSRPRSGGRGCLCRRRRRRSRSPCRCTSRGFRWGACRLRRRGGRGRCADGRLEPGGAGRSCRMCEELK